MKIRPEIVAPENPVGADAAVRYLQGLLSSIYYLDGQDQKPWFEKGVIFGLAEAHRDPKILWKGKDFYPLNPNDNFPIISFFYESDPRNQVNNHNEYDLNLIVWFNQDKFFPGADFRIKEFLINDIQNAFDVEVFRVYKNNIFADFKLSDKNIINSKFDGFRINIKYHKELECGVKLNVNT